MMRQWFGHRWNLNFFGRAEMANKQETTEKKTSTKPCPACGAPQSQWTEPNGYPKGNKTYCCEGCADQSGCTCEPS
jgi:hypothetical protein